MAFWGEGGTKKDYLIELGEECCWRVIYTPWLVLNKGKGKSQKARTQAGRNKSATQSRDIHHRYPGTSSSGPRVLVSIDLININTNSQFPSFFLNKNNIEPPSSSSAVQEQCLESLSTGFQDTDCPAILS